MKTTIEYYKKNEDATGYKGYDFVALLNKMDGRSMIRIGGGGKVRVHEARKACEGLDNVEMIVKHTKGFNRTWYIIKGFKPFDGAGLVQVEFGIKLRKKEKGGM